MSLKGTPRLLLILPLVAVAILVVMFTSAGAPTRLKAFRIPSKSMEPSLLVGDFLIVELLSGYRPGRDDLVVFASVEESDLTVLSRVVAIAGDTVGMSGGELFLNHPQPSWSRRDSSEQSRTDSPELLDHMARWQEPFLLHPTREYAPDHRNWGPVVVPPGAFLVVGDNREFSYDSRYWGFLPASNILGRPRYVYYSYDPESYRALPWLSAVRWARIGQRPH